MSVKVMTRVWETSKQKGSNLLLLIALADNAHDDGTCYPGLDHLQNKIRMSRRQTQRILDNLDAAGEIFTRAGGSGRGDKTYYFIASGLTETEIREGLLNHLGLSPDEIALLGDKLTPNKGRKDDTPKKSKKGVNLSNKGVKLSKKGDISKSKNGAVSPVVETENGQSAKPTTVLTVLEPYVEPAVAGINERVQNPFGSDLDSIPPKQLEKIETARASIAIPRLSEETPKPESQPAAPSLKEAAKANPSALPDTHEKVKVPPPRKPQPSDVLYDALSKAFFDGVKSERVGWILWGNPRVHCGGLVASECARQGQTKATLDYAALAALVPDFKADYQNGDANRELKECGKFVERWEGWRNRKAGAVAATSAYVRIKVTTAWGAEVEREVHRETLKTMPEGSYTIL